MACTTRGTQGCTALQFDWESDSESKPGDLENLCGRPLGRAFLLTTVELRVALMSN